MKKLVLLTLAATVVAGSAFAAAPVTKISDGSTKVQADYAFKQHVSNGGGHKNHTMFWEIMTKPDTSKLQGPLKEAIDAELGGYDVFVESFSAAAATRFGSGWAWLVVNKEGNLEVTSTANQDNPLLEGKKAILCLDVWEHAYYLHYQNRRPDYIKEFFRVINWDKVSENYEKALKPHHD